MQTYQKHAKYHEILIISHADLKKSEIQDTIMMETMAQ